MKASKTVMVLPWRNGRALRRIAWHIVTSIPEFLSHFGLTIEMVKDLTTVPSSANEIAESLRKISDDAAEAVKQQWTDESSKQVHHCSSSISFIAVDKGRFSCVKPA
ncbi:DinB family protein [Saccharococcus caldoxylosilyticus]|uniref:DinB family protein n=1 Tax=Saccharococcus caldoxylosilyticus TaxID=81408 RepID=UPI002FCD6990